MNDYDSEFRFGGRPLVTLQAMDRGGRVVYVGSFSKVMLPSLRLGFLISPPALHLGAMFRSSSVGCEHDVVRRALTAGVRVGGLSVHYAGRAVRSGLVFGYGAIATPRIDEGLKRLRACFAAR